MSEQLQLRRGTAAQLAAFTPQAGELVVDTTNNRLVVGDGATAGGFPAAQLAETPLATNALNTLASGANGGESSVRRARVPCLGPVRRDGHAADADPGQRDRAFGRLPRHDRDHWRNELLGRRWRHARAIRLGLGLTLGSVNNGLIGPTAFYSATSLVLTAAGSNFTGGAVRLSIHYILAGPSTS